MWNVQACAWQTSLKQLRYECERLQREVGHIDASQMAELQRQHCLHLQSLQVGRCSSTLLLEWKRPLESLDCLRNLMQRHKGLFYTPCGQKYIICLYLVLEQKNAD